MKKIDKRLYNEAINTFGAPAQAVIAMEECSELIKEISKALRNKINRGNIAEEIADVEIMVEQLKLMFDVEEIVEQFIKIKNDRIAELIKKAKAGQNGK